MTPAETISACCAAIQPADAAARAAARSRLDQLTMPPWAMGRLMDLAVDLAGIAGSLQVGLRPRAVVVLAGDHGVCAQGVSQFPQEVTPQMVANFVNGGAAINAMARNADAAVVVADLGMAAPVPELYRDGRVRDLRVGAGTGDIAVEPAMSRAQAEQAIAAGIALAQELCADHALLATGEMGIGNTTPSAAITAVRCARDAALVTGRGTGIDSARLQHKTAVVQQAIDRAGVDPSDGIGVLAELGGFEIGGLAGLMLGCGSARRPVAVDGFIAGAAALIAQALCPRVVDYLLPSHSSAEPGHVAQLRQLGKEALLDLGLRLGEGTGAALAMPLYDAAARLLTEVATFEEAAVSAAQQSETRSG